MDKKKDGHPLVSESEENHSEEVEEGHSEDFDSLAGGTKSRT